MSDLPPAGDIALVVAGALVAGFLNGLSGTGYALASLGFWLHACRPPPPRPWSRSARSSATSSPCRASGTAWSGSAFGRSSLRAWSACHRHTPARRVRVQPLKSASAAAHFL